MFLADRTVPSSQTFFALRRTAELSSDWLIGVRRLLHCAVFVVVACRVYHRGLFCLVLFLSVVFLAPAFLWIFSLVRSFV